MDGLYLPDLACLKAIKVMRESPSKIRFLASKEIAIFEANKCSSSFTHSVDESFKGPAAII
jgi:hypothetical protein